MDDQFNSGAISCGAITLFQEATDYTGPERREHRRYTRSIGITVQPLDPRQTDFSPKFDAITREVSRSGLSYLSGKAANAEMVSISLQEDDTRMVVCRVCECNAIQRGNGQSTFLTSVEFLYERQA